MNATANASATASETDRDPPIDAGIVAALERARSLGATPRDLADIGAARAQVEREQAWWRERQEALSEVSEAEIDLGNRRARVRLYRPHGATAGAVLYLHGGGWSLGSIDTHDNVARGLAAGSAATVVSLDYALAPEAPFPQPYHESLAAARALRSAEGRRLGVEAAALGLAGDSAGANLAVAVAMALRDGGEPAQALGLFYGAYDTRLDSGSYRRFGDGRYGLSHKEMAQFFDYYLPAPAQREDPFAAPLRGDLAALPPAYLLACGLDVLRDDSLLLAAALTQAGVPYRLDHQPGAVHGFLRFGPAVPLSARCLAAAGAFMREALA